NTLDLRYKENIIEVSSPDFVISSVLQRSEQKAETEEERTPVEKLVDSTRPHLKLDLSRVALTSIAGMIALTGLFMDNIPIIIGAMLLSPLLGPVYAFAVNAALGRAKDVLKTIGNLTALLIMVIVVSCVATFLISQVTDLSLTAEIRARMDSNFVYILMAILLGFATMCALSKDISESIAGVAIAAALLPPAVVAGISLVLYPGESMKPLVLTLENVLGLMAGSLAATPILHIRPRRTHRKAAARRLIFRTASVLAVLLLLLALVSILLT
ncbi:MAG: TIGR00341 family protein, partial [Theionarchaea archaeon]|nr:TIGR00341 family protein [Theionarchaea archaeon]